VEYITLPGWETSIADVRDYEKLPHNAKKYIEMIEEKVQVPGMYVCMYVCMYAGESKIIRTIGTCFAVGYTAGWA
jgi:hypothetical protein